MDKQTVVHPYNGILLNNKKELTTDTHSSDESQKQYWVKEPSSKILYITWFHLYNICEKIKL